MTVFSTCDPSVLLFMKSMLEQAGISFLVRGDEHVARMQSAQGFPWFIIQVPREVEAEARSLLNELDPEQQ